MRPSLSANRKKLIWLAALLLIGAALLALQPELWQDVSKAPSLAPSADPNLSSDEEPEVAVDADAIQFEAERTEFRHLTKHTLRHLPHVSDLRALSADELETAPKPVREAAVQMGTVADWLERHPGHEAEGLEFYQKCSLEPEFITPVRALCLSHALMMYADQHHALWAYDPEKIPEQVLELAKDL